MWNKLIFVLFVLVAAAPERITFSGRGLLYPQLVESFYKHRNFKKVWTEKRLVQQLYDQISKADEHGLQRDPYHFRKFDDGNDLLLTDVFFAYAHDLRFGRALHRLKGVGWQMQHNDRELVPILQNALTSGEIGKELEALAPSYSAYRSLQKALLKYRHLSETEIWPELTAPIDYEAEENTPEVEQLEARLISTKDLQPGMKLIDGILQFQRRHGLSIDGIVGKQTVAALNVPPKHRVQQIELSLERMRWMPRDALPRQVVVNVPGLDLRIYEQGKLISTMLVIAGRTTWCTPTFLNSEIEEIILNPYWYVPAAIVRSEIYPLMHKDPGYLQKNRIRVISRPDGSVRLRQAPGPGNALGQIKFLFSNCCDCYLHDTPQKALFDKVLRFFSHGCIRLERAIDLGNWILKEEGWSEERLLAEIETNKTQTIKLNKTVPIYIVYFTAWVDEDGLVQFRNDVYGKDRELMKSLGAM